MNLIIVAEAFLAGGLFRIGVEEMDDGKWRNAFVSWGLMLALLAFAAHRLAEVTP